MTPPRATEYHLIQLCRDHAALQAEIDGEMARPSPDDVLLRDLKRRKLQLKDQIARLHAPVAGAA